MLAPRKTLWSTPIQAVDHLEKWIPSFQDGDKICDIGCGDGRILLEWAERISNRSPSHDDILLFPKIALVGIDIDEDRIETCKRNLEKLREEDRLHSNLSISFVCGNALEEQASEKVLQDATIVFIYLIPRGIKLIYPMLVGRKPIKVISYMAKLPGGEEVTERALLEVDHQPGAAWPLYFYDLR